jgi:hypothetical protein
MVPWVTVKVAIPPLAPVVKVYQRFTLLVKHVGLAWSKLAQVLLPVTEVLVVTVPKLVAFAQLSLPGAPVVMSTLLEVENKPLLPQVTTQL